ncbi:MAG TPA: hypothetical protein VNA15_01915, partial [Candidatus Angelobacter sp.]|nr:hypothetical protein [Candidatus Angelobacter sp.]
MRKRKPSLRLGLPVMVIGIAMITIAYLNVGTSPEQQTAPMLPADVSKSSIFCDSRPCRILRDPLGVLQTILGLII